MGTISPGQVDVLMPGLRRLTAPNAGMMTGPGTNSYLIGTSEVAVIDPGPAIDSHIDALVAAAPGPIRWILCTHTHHDHSPAASLLAERTGAKLYGMPAPEHGMQDKTFKPHFILIDGDSVSGPDFELEAIHTPGHASNHLCYLWRETGILFTGDHIMAGSTVVIGPPDGNMYQYLKSLEKLKSHPLEQLAPAHGELLPQPMAVIDWLIGHRLKREAKVLERLGQVDEADLHTLVRSVYDDVQPVLHPVAERSLLAHLEKLEQEGHVLRIDERWQVGR